MKKLIRRNNPVPNEMSLQDRTSVMIFSDVIYNYVISANRAKNINIPESAKFAYISADAAIWVKPVIQGSPTGSPVEVAEIPSGSPLGSPEIVTSGSVLIPANTPQIRGIYGNTYLSIISSSNARMSIEWFDASLSIVKRFF